MESKCTEEDWDKLKRVLDYLPEWRTGWHLGPRSGQLTNMRCCVDASYATHEDMKSQTGRTTLFGRGAIMCKSSKQTLNTKSSSEAELVGASDCITKPTWLKTFMSGQVYQIDETVFYQDNQSTIRFESNGRKSSGQRAIDIRYFFIKDRFDSRGMVVEYCPTQQMLADFFTKPLQGCQYI